MKKFENSLEGKLAVFYLKEDPTNSFLDIDLSHYKPFKHGERASVLVSIP